MRICILFFIETYVFFLDSSVEKLAEEPENVLSGRLATLVNVLNVMKPRRKHVIDETTPNLIPV